MERASQSALNLKVVPMEPRSSDTLPAVPGYLFQVKWDGIRLLAHIEGNRLVLRNRSLRESTGDYEELNSLPQLVEKKSCILDGELTAFKQGRPCFFTLMKRVSGSGSSRMKEKATIPLYYMVFDLLFQEGNWLLSVPWEERQQMLRQTLQESGHVFITPFSTEGETLFNRVQERELEGVVAKMNASPYVPGPAKSGYWLKIKITRKLKALVGGISLREGRPRSLLLGLEEEKESSEKAEANATLRFIGSVSSGLKEKDLQAWLAYGVARAAAPPPFFNPPQISGRDVLWVAPPVEIEVLYSEWTPGLKLRSPRVAGPSCPAMP